MTGFAPSFRPFPHTAYLSEIQTTSLSTAYGFLLQPPLELSGRQKCLVVLHQAKPQIDAEISLAMSAAKHPSHG